MIRGGTGRYGTVRVDWGEGWRESWRGATGGNGRQAGGKGSKKKKTCFVIRGSVLKFSLQIIYFLLFFFKRLETKRDYTKNREAREARKTIF